MPYYKEGKSKGVIKQQFNGPNRRYSYDPLVDYGVYNVSFDVENDDESGWMGIYSLSADQLHIIFGGTLAELKAWFPGPAGSSSTVRINITENTQFAELKTFLAEKEKRVTIDLTGSTITTIPDSAFEGCEQLGGIIIPDNITSIGKEAFYGCKNLSSVTIGSGVTGIGDDAFSGCQILQRVIIPDTVESIGVRAFYNCNQLKSAIIGNGVTSIGNSAFYYCNNLYELTIGNSVESIGAQVFNNCNQLTSISIPASVTSINSSAFNLCAYLTEITVEDANSKYAAEGGILFNKEKTVLLRYPEGKGNSTFNIPAGITSIGDNAFYRCKLTGITIPDGVTSIGEYSFYNSGSLASATIGKDVESIGKSAFMSCNSLTSVTFEGDDTTWAAGDDPSFLGNDSLNTAYSAGKKGTYTRSGTGNSSTWTKT